MNAIRTKLAVLKDAEAECAVRRAAVTASWRGFKQQFEAAATPKRVVVAGLAAGFVAGLPSVGEKSAGALGGKLLGMVLEAAFTSISAAVAAGAGAASAQPGTQPEPAGGASTEPGEGN